MGRVKDIEIDLHKIYDKLEIIAVTTCKWAWFTPLYTFAAGYVVLVYLVDKVVRLFD
ncbi:hypothetical protein HYI07_07805 [Clostridium botulinum]|uniref:Uncharacterized protein n=2 Tax=Clostridium botulinum TaxID=1491 RepID=A7GAA5_CLOBL|nr:hypothetical protein [Clostridium botulinum]EKX80818.1 hypothetical protein CFSAN001628_004188 [Clostridium botulinum CFSAN001628]ABS42808.1 hypothetical protein CLI_0419 [Clostridium botulinum F str. Langeland]ACA45927.1 hypothetical protein CLD_0404 [Clostridium botulinum B1 str. Okra]ADF98180.1 hypothetical protein CBF_0387 [Clostridium botulinum F str. 230613]MBD5561829.1 hypothetical protein [Clostridium botulinum]